MSVTPVPGYEEGKNVVDNRVVAPVSAGEVK